MAAPSLKSIGKLSGKHALVDKANSTVLIAVAVAAAVLVFSGFAAKSLITKINYQNKVIGLRQDAKDQLDDNLEAKDQLVAKFAAFEDTAESVIGTSDKNSKIVLDALPSKYDFPALATSLDSIITGAGLAVISVTGEDNELTAEQSNITPIPIEIPFEVTAEGSYDAVQKLIKDLERSIRPFSITSIQFSADTTNTVSVTVIGKTYYQPTKEIGVENLKVDTSGKFIENDTTSTEEGQE